MTLSFSRHATCVITLLLLLLASAVVAFNVGATPPHMAALHHALTERIGAIDDVIILTSARKKESKGLIKALVALECYTGDDDKKNLAGLAKLAGAVAKSNTADAAVLAKVEQGRSRLDQLGLSLRQATRSAPTVTSWSSTMRAASRGTTLCCRSERARPRGEVPRRRVDTRPHHAAAPS